jgi:hypothetical protein
MPKGIYKRIPNNLIKYADEDSFVVNKRTGCWDSKYFWGEHSYCRIYRNGKCQKHATYFYEKLVGKVKKGMHLDYLCRNTQCVNPKHLEIVTPKENTRRGKATKLSLKNVEKIRSLIGYKQKEIASMFGIHPSEISRILNGRRWI